MKFVTEVEEVEFNEFNKVYVEIIFKYILLIWLAKIAVGLIPNWHPELPYHLKSN